MQAAAIFAVGGYERDDFSDMAVGIDLTRRDLQAEAKKARVVPWGHGQRVSTLLPRPIGRLEPRRAAGGRGRSSLSVDG